MKIKRRFLSLLLAICFVTGLVPATSAYSASKEEENPTIYWDVSEAKEAKNLDENFESQTTISIPVADEGHDLEVVFVIDGSIRTYLYRSSDGESSNNIIAQTFFVDYDDYNDEADQFNTLFNEVGFATTAQ